jgi:hypothetical protein
MENKYDPKEIIEIIISSKKYLNQTIEEAGNILRKNAPEVGLLYLDSLLEFMRNRTISNNNNLFNYVKKEFRLDEGDRIKLYMFDNYFMAGIVKHISEYAKNLDPKDPYYNDKVNHIKKFINNLEDRTIFYIIYADSLKRVFKELDGKEKYSLKDYDDILQKMSNDLANNVEKRLEDLIKNSEQTYENILGTKGSYMSKLTKPLYKILEKVRNKFYH